MNILVENSHSLKLLYSKIEDDQNNFLNKFKEEESLLEDNFKELEQLKLILNNDELQLEVNNYNKSLNNFNIRIEKFNLHYNNQINNLKNSLINKIIDILKVYSQENKIDLILDADNYILSSNSINITEIILDKLNKKPLEVVLEKYK